MIYKKIGIFLLCFATCMASSAGGKTGSDADKQVQVLDLEQVLTIESNMMDGYRAADSEVKAYLDSGILQAFMNATSDNKLPGDNVELYNRSRIKGINDIVNNPRLDVTWTERQFYFWFKMQAIDWKKENNISLTEEDVEFEKQFIEMVKKNYSWFENYTQEDRGRIRQAELAKSTTRLQRFTVDAKSKAGALISTTPAQVAIGLAAAGPALVGAAVALATAPITLPLLHGYLKYTTGKGVGERFRDATTFGSSYRPNGR